VDDRGPQLAKLKYAHVDDLAEYRRGEVATTSLPLWTTSGSYPAPGRLAAAVNLTRRQDLP